MIKVGEKAPEFEQVMAYQNGEFRKVGLSDYKGKWLVFFFYPRDFTFVCPTEIKEFSDNESNFKDAGAEILSASTDSEFSHKAWFEKDLPEIKFPILADTTQRISDIYGVLGNDGASQRGTFIIDPNQNVRWINVSDNSVGRSVKEVLRSLKALQTGELCPVNWEKGDKTLGK